MACAWCGGAIPEGARADSVFCGKVCRQRAWRLRERKRELAERPQRARQPLRMAYADPPYPGLSRRYYGGEASFAGEVDHVALLEQLAGFDGWALSTGGFAVRELLPLCPDGARLCPWVKPARHWRTTYGLHNAWEALIVVPGRRLRPAVCDWLAAAPARLGGSKLAGRKPLKFVAWMFECLGLLPGDELVDLFPGSGVVSRAWAEVNRAAEDLDVAEGLRATRRVVPARAAARGTTARAGSSGSTARTTTRRGNASAPPASARDASRAGRRRRVPLGVCADR